MPLTPSKSTSHEPNSGGTSPKHGFSFKRTWVTCAHSGDMEVQRLSKIAFKERRKTNFRWRLMQGGVVVACYATKAELEATLSDPNASPEKRTMISQVARVPVLDAESPRSGDLRSPTPPSGPPRSPAGRDEEEDDTGVTLRPPKASEPIAAMMATKAHMTPEERRERRKSVMKPVDPRQLPHASEEVLAWFYDEPSQSWTCREMQVQLADESFAEGGVRAAYRMGVRDGKEEKEYVAKKFNTLMESEIQKMNVMSPEKGAVVLEKSAILLNLEKQNDSKFEIQFAQRVLPPDAKMTTQDFRTWFTRLCLFKADVVMQGFCQAYAEAYNARNPPKKVVFLEAFLIVCHKRPDQPVYACEPMISGDFEKYNNNAGEVHERANERNTPQAFSHFSYIHSGRRHIIVDIQGVGDTYTDPQIHSIDRYFSMGDLRQDGIDAFFATHRCNNICVGLGLAEDHKRIDKMGTVYRPPPKH